ncbi:MAG: hypothetical protein PUE36_00680 [Bacteroidales bacterium]|nr:hypothetical protein [Bacteroidales bacterium]
MKTRLRLGAILHFVISIGHFACLFFLEEALKAYHILDEMNSICFGQTWLLYAVTVVIALTFAIAGLYALSATGDIRQLSLQRYAIIAIVTVYVLRAGIGLGCLLWSFSYLELFSSLTPAFLVWCYWPGIHKMAAPNITPRLPKEKQKYLGNYHRKKL